jgi:signal transduction histidine kinase
MPNKQRISRKLERVFLLQILFISIAVLLSIATARFVLGGILIQRALQDESNYFWQRYRLDPDCSLPDTNNLKAYLSPRQTSAQIPPEIEGLADGFHPLPRERGFAVAQVSREGEARLYLVFDGKRVEELALFFGMIPLAAGLTGLYVAALLGYRLSRQAVSPILALARQVDLIQRESPDRSLLALEQIPPGDDEEVRALSQALSRLSARILQFIERERTFTRDVSHELRSPITVIRMAADVLMQDGAFGESQRAHLARIKRAAVDMEELTSAFLLLSREEAQGPQDEAVCVNTVVREEMERAAPLLQGKSVQAVLDEPAKLYLNVSHKVLSIVIGNLIRNAYAYTGKGEVRIGIEQNALCIEDTGSGIAEDQMDKVFQAYYRGTEDGEGHGVGLAIVSRLCSRFGWPLQLSSSLGLGTRARLELPGAVLQARENFSPLD